MKQHTKPKGTWRKEWKGVHICEYVHAACISLGHAGGGISSLRSVGLPLACPLGYLSSHMCTTNENRVDFEEEQYNLFVQDLIVTQTHDVPYIVTQSHDVLSRLQVVLLAEPWGPLLILKQTLARKDTRSLPTSKKLFL